MGFQFSLAAVLRVRESVEKREEEILRKIQAEIALLTHQLEEYRAAMLKTRKVQESALLSTVPAGQLHTMIWEQQSISEKLQAMQQQLRVLVKQRGEQLIIYQAAHRNCEMLTEMRERQHQDYLVSQSREQQKRLDDLFIIRWRRG